MELVSAAQKAAAVICLFKKEIFPLMGEVYSHHKSEVCVMFSQKQFDYGMRSLSLIIAAAIFFLSAQSRLPIPSASRVPGFDKLLHVCAFGCLAFIFSYWFSIEQWNTKPLKCFCIVCFVIACYGISDEIHQSFVPGREVSVYDWFADCTGAFLASILRLKMVRRGISNKKLMNDDKKEPV